MKRADSPGSTSASGRWLRDTLPSQPSSGPAAAVPRPGPGGRLEAFSPVLHSSRRWNRWQVLVAGSAAFALLALAAGRALDLGVFPGGLAAELRLAPVGRGAVAALFTTAFVLAFLREHLAVTRLRRSKLASLHATEAHAVVHADAHGRIVGYSDAVRTVFACPARRILGASFLDFLPVRERSSAWRVFRNTGAGAADGSILHVVGRRAHGEEFPLEARIASFPGPRGPEFLAAIRDETDDKRAEESMRLSAELLRAIPEAVILLDLEGRIIRWLGRAEEIFGYAASDAVGRPFSFMGADGSDQTISTGFLRRAHGGGIYRGEIECRRGDGRTVAIDITSEIVCGDDARPHYFVTICRDITDKRRLEDDLDRFFALSMDMFSISGFDGFLKHANPAWESTTGWRPAELKSRPWFEFVHPDDREAVKQALGKLALGRDVAQMEMRLTCRDGSHRWCLWTANSLVSQGVIYAVGRDITQRREYEDALHAAHVGLTQRVKDRTAELESSNEKLQREIKGRMRMEAWAAEEAAELERSNRDLEAFAYLASHDLQEPLRVIANYAGLVAERYHGRLDADADDFLAFITTGVRRMRHMIQDMLDYSRAGSGAVESGPTDCEAAFTQAVANLKSAVQESGAVIEHEPLPVVFGSEVQFTQVFQNLIGNAIKYRGKATPLVQVGAAYRDGEWVFHVRDSGIGIDPSKFSSIFQIFTRLPEGGTTPGAGLGLALVKRVIERHGGRVWVESEPGKGSTFYFTAKAVQVPEEAMR